MSTGTLTRADLTEAVFQAVGLSRTDSAQMVEDMLEEVCGALAKGETVKLSYSGGAFSAGELLLASFKATLQAACPNYQLVQPMHAPHVGAALYAAKLWARVV